MAVKLREASYYTEATEVLTELCFEVLPATQDTEAVAESG